MAVAALARRATLVLAVGASLPLLAPSPGAAGPVVRYGDERFAVLQVDVSPPKASTKRHLQAAAVEIDWFTGNDLNGEQPSGGDVFVRHEFRAPKGAQINSDAFPVCSASTLLKQGPAGCPAKSRVGVGNVLLDPRPLFPFTVSARATVFNSTSGFAPAIAIYAKTVYGQSDFVIWSVRPATGAFGPRFVTGDGEAAVAYYRQIELSMLKRTTIYRHRRVPFIATPRTCRGAWRFQVVSKLASGDQIVTHDQAPCAPG